MRVRKFEVSGLFGLFNHSIEFNLSRRITIIHAPNGYGKTVILKLLEGFFGGSLIVFRQYKFDQINIEFENGEKITINQHGTAPDLIEDRRRPIRFAYSITSKKGRTSKTWDPAAEKGDEEVFRRIGSHTLRDYLPYLVPSSPNTMRDHRTGETMTVREAIERHWDELPPSLRTRMPHPEWLAEIRKSVVCRLIETQRLMVARKEGRVRTEEQPLIPAVRSYADDLASAIGRALEESATLSQSLDRTFPNRLLRRRSDVTPPLSETELRERLASLEQLRARLTKTGILDRSTEESFIPTEAFDEPTQRILTEYVEDNRKKLDVYISLLEKVELFTDLINSRFQFKTVQADRNRGFVFVDSSGLYLDVSSLSSGEQHELVLIYELIFKTIKNSLILIDEPEISLHVAWQKRFLDDLGRIVSLSPMDVVISTHSPQLIGGHLDLLVPLKAPGEDNAGV